MSSKLRWKVLTIVLVLLVFGAVGVYPILAARVGISSPNWLIDKQLKLGLDLKGGVHLVIRVETDYALRHESEQAMERLREELTKRGISEREPCTKVGLKRVGQRGNGPERPANESRRLAVRRR